MRSTLKKRIAFIILLVIQCGTGWSPTGQGPGLGLSLSLSYDIVKAHGRELKVKTTENEGTEFFIELPVNKNES